MDEKSGIEANTNSLKKGVVIFDGGTWVTDIRDENNKPKEGVEGQYWIDTIDADGKRGTKRIYTVRTDGTFTLMSTPYGITKLRGEKVITPDRPIIETPTGWRATPITKEVDSKKTVSLQLTPPIVSPQVKPAL